MSRRTLRRAFLLFTALFILGSLSSCGGGGGGGSNSTPPGNSNWDALIWDRDQWS